MQKIPTLFVRDNDNPKLVTQKVDPECQWVIDGEGVPTEKWDGTCCAVIGGRLYRRHKHDGAKGEPPNEWIHWSRVLTQRSGHGWLLVEDGPQDRWHREALGEPWFPDRTYELVGPKIQSNPYRRDDHVLMPHGGLQLAECERTFVGIRDWLTVARPMEGVVWHHPDGRMAKIKRRDFGLPWPPS